MRLGFKKVLTASGMLAALVGVVAIGQPAPASAAQAAAPQYRFDPSWPKPLPNNWIMQAVGNIFVDKQDNIWVLNRPADINGDEKNAEVKPNPTGECCVTSPAVFKFNAAGDVLAAWGTRDMPGWPQDEHTIFVDDDGFVWIGGSTAGDTLQKYTADGKLVWEFGHRGPAFEGPAEKQPANNQQTDLLQRGVSGGTIDTAAKELYITDGYLNKRVLVYDSVTGAFKRGWGAYGKPLSEITNEWIPRNMTPGAAPIKEFRAGVHCVALSKDGLVYVCDRAGNRVQVFTKDGRFQKEIFVADRTIDRGSAGSVSFSPDPAQSHLFVSDIQNATVWIVNRQTGETVGRMGRRSYNGGDFGQLHFAASDSKGNVYTGEIGQAGRVQRFSPVTPWPR